MDFHWLARAGSIWPVLWAGGQVLLSSARRRTMFERFTDRARRVVVLAEEEARMLSHNYVGTEHILLGLIREGGGVATQVLVKLGAELNRLRQQVIQLISAQQPRPAGRPPGGGRTRGRGAGSPGRGRGPAGDR
jgi:Clp amino terminal domain, pathogenicity island component